MTVTVNLARDVELAYVAAAQTQGVTIDALVTDVLVSHAPVAGPAHYPEMIEERGIPVLRSGRPIDPSVVSCTLDAIRRDRDLSRLGQR